MSEMNFSIELPRWTMADYIGYTPITTFWEDFSIAEKGGLNAIKDTYNSALQWKKNIKYMAELLLVVNHKSIVFAELTREGSTVKDAYRWYYRNLSDVQIDEIMNYYIDKYYEIREYVYSDNSPFTQEEIDYFFKITD